MSKLEALALKIARSRRQRLDAQKVLKNPQHTESEIADAIVKLQTARKDWKFATAALWRLVAKIDGGEA